MHCGKKRKGASPPNPLPKRKGEPEARWYGGTVARDYLNDVVIPLLRCYDITKLRKIKNHYMKRLMENDSTFVEIDSVEDVSIYGRCGDGTAMHTLELITDQGDTLYIGVNEDSVSNVKGGMGVGDRMAVTLESEATDDEPAKARVVVNLTTLLGKWVSLDKSFEIQEGGVVVSNITEPKPLVDWKICNGRLVLSSDTFSIYELGADSLFLENERGIYAYKRLK